MCCEKPAVGQTALYLDSENLGFNPLATIKAILSPLSCNLHTVKEIW